MNKPKNTSLEPNVSILMKESSNGIWFDGTHASRTVSCNFVFPERLPPHDPRIAQWTGRHPSWLQYWQNNTTCSQPYNPSTGFPCQHTTGRTIRCNLLLPHPETIINDLLEAHKAAPAEYLAMGLRESGLNDHGADPNQALLHLAFFYMRNDSLDNPRHGSMKIDVADHCPNHHSCRRTVNHKVLAALLRYKDTVEKKNGINDPFLDPIP